MSDRSAVAAGKTVSAGRVSGRRTGRDHGQVETAGPRRRLEDYRYVGFKRVFLVLRDIYYSSDLVFSMYVADSDFQR